jgi:hypothetical protein
MLHHDNRSTDSQAATTVNGFVSATPTKTKLILLQTAEEKLVTDDGQEVPVGFLLDTGSQRSYITKKAADPVALQGPSELLSVATLEEESSQTKRMKRVRFSLASAQGNFLRPIEMEALTIDKICTSPVKLDIHKYL